jgi:translation initiation factor 1 (eIF-1/SUI1)
MKPQEDLKDVNRKLAERVAAGGQSSEKGGICGNITAQGAFA